MFSGLIEYQSELNILFDNIPHEIHKKLLIGSLTNLTIDEISKLPKNLLYILPVSKFNIFLYIFDYMYVFIDT